MKLRYCVHAATSPGTGRRPRGTVARRRVCAPFRLLQGRRARGESLPEWAARALFGIGIGRANDDPRLTTHGDILRCFDLSRSVWQRQRASERRYDRKLWIAEPVTLLPG